MFPRQMTFIKGDSSKTLLAYAEQHPKSCDMFSVDGSHEYNAVKTDILNAIKATRPGGSISPCLLSVSQLTAW